MVEAAAVEVGAGAHCWGGWVVRCKWYCPLEVVVLSRRICMDRKLDQ